ncbi:tetratricopeptide repeat protein [Polyangium fumosum]|uniref:Tetratricopeptide repeat protein n=1 Tax=Polyangium fumosum TaxID=889272 RepID=A0A4U1J0X5_9BACT|nr:hypothetical protein [Polyangium fumosum]TKD00651.1 hypothetical protein E8A74_33535 [Polyangium fumosum]
MGHFLIGDADFEYRSFATFPLLAHVLGVGRMFCAPRFELVDEEGAPLDEEDAFLAELGEAAPQLFLPYGEDLVTLPSTADLDLVLGHLLARLRQADVHIRVLRDEGHDGARVRWSLPFVWELRKDEWGALLATIQAALPGETSLSLEFLQAEETEELLDRLFDPDTPLGRLVSVLPETHAFGLAALAFAVAHDMPVFTVEDEPVFYTFDEGGESPRFMSRLESTVLAAPEETRIEQVNVHADSALQALEEERIADALADAAQARAWTWGVRDAAAIAGAYRSSATAWLEAGELDRAITDASWAIYLEPDADAFDTRGIARHLVGDVAGAIADYTSSLELDPEAARVLSNRAEAFFDQGDDEACIADAERSMALDPEYATAFVWRGRALLRMGRADEARADAERGAALGDAALWEEMGAR